MPPSAPTPQADPAGIPAVARSDSYQDERGRHRPFPASKHNTRKAYILVPASPTSLSGWTGSLQQRRYRRRNPSPESPQAYQSLQADGANILVADRPRGILMERRASFL